MGENNMKITNWEKINLSKREPSWINKGNKYYGKGIQIKYSSLNGNYVVMPSRAFNLSDKKFSNINDAKKYATKIMMRYK